MAAHYGSIRATISGGSARQSNPLGNEGEHLIRVMDDHGRMAERDVAVKFGI